MVFSLQSFDRIPWAVAVFMVRRHVRIAGWLLITALTDLTWLAHLVVESCTSSDVFSLWTCCGWQRSCWRICKYFQAGQSMLQLLVWLHMSGTEPGSARVHNSAQNLLLGVALWSGPGALFQLQNPEILMRASLLALTCCLPNCWHGKQNAESLETEYSSQQNSSNQLLLNALCWIPNWLNRHWERGTCFGPLSFVPKSVGGNPPALPFCCAVPCRSSLHVADLSA